MKFKGVEKNSVIREIGSLFRHRDSSDWHINVKLTPNQKKQYFGVSQIPILARRRMVNATEQRRPAGFQSNVVIENTRHWRAEQIEACSIPALSRQDDRQQWCFLFESNKTSYYLPQLELARVLFFHHAYLARLSLIHNGLSQDFDVQILSGTSKSRINILPTCTLPLFVRGDYSLRRLLAWILLDDDARKSFESIACYQFQQGYDTEKYRLWRFKFEPPQLESVELKVRGHFDQKRGEFFVYEIYGVSNLTCDCPTYVDFVDPRFTERYSGQGRVNSPRPVSGSELEIDDEQEPNADHSRIRIDSAAVAFEFANPFQTSRRGMGKSHAGSRGLEEDLSDIQESTGFEVSTDEASTHGTLPSADFDGVDDTSEDSDLYAEKFQLFEEMIGRLVSMSQCSHMRREIRKLPGIEGYSKHLLADGNPRCLVFHLISKGDEVYALLEVDTSDNKNSLSTLFVKQESSSMVWNEHISELEIRLLKRSLVWPTSFLDQVFGSDCKRIPHQRTADKSLQGQDSIQRWAERIYLEILLR